jgi:hypothetical protein
MNADLGQLGYRVEKILGLAPKLFFKPVVEPKVASLFFTCSSGLRAK